MSTTDQSKKTSSTPVEQEKPTTVVPDDATGAVKAPDAVIVPLEVPIKRGNTMIDSITLRRPNPGALRGLSLIDLATMNVTALQKLLPRITTPTLTETDISLHLDPADLTAIGVEVAGFLVRSKDKQDFQ